jgi:ABC-2 type transport system ATP-binding protein
MTDMIRVEALHRSYGAVRAVDDVSFSVPAGQILGFMGPNGAGKTTTLRILTGLLAPTSGTAHVAGYQVGAPGDRSRDHLGYLPETAPSYEELTVEGYLRFVAKIRALSPKTAVGPAIERCGLDEMRRRPIGTLSKGYRQRVGLAQAILHDPKVLILDEPTSGLDPAQRVAMRAVIRQVGSDRTVIFSSHVMQEVEAVADRVLIMHRGRLVADDTPRRLAEGRGLQLKLAGVDLDAARARLAGVEGVRQVETRADHLWIDVPEERAPAIARATVEAGWDLVSLSPAPSSLEAAFIRLTQAG